MPEKPGEESREACPSRNQEPRLRRQESRLRNQESRLPRYALWMVLGGALALGALQGLQVFVSFALAGDEITLSHAMVTVVSWLLTAALLPIPYYLSTRIPLEGGRSPGAWVAHVGGCLAFALLHLVANAALHDSQTLGGFTSQFLFLLRFFFILNVVTYWASVLAVHAWGYYRELQLRERRGMALEMELAAARLQVLRAQLNPHFLFNTLNTLATLAETGDPKGLSNAIAKVSELLRLSLDEKSGGETTLAEEMKAAKTYAEIQKLRFGDRLDVNIDPDPLAMDAAVPTLILQPLIENSIEHGMQDSVAAVHRVEVSAHLSDGRLTLAVFDSGPGFSIDDEGQRGVGLPAVIARLEHLYGGDAVLNVLQPTTGGGLVQIEMPYRPRREKTRSPNP